MRKVPGTGRKSRSEEIGSLSQCRPPMRLRLQPVFGAHLFRAGPIIGLRRPARSVAYLVGLIDVLRHAPLFAASAWFLLAILQVYRDRWHTWTETFFLAACFFAGLYAVSDWLFFNADPARPDLAVVSAQASLGSLTLAAVFLLLFTAVYLDRMRR